MFETGELVTHVRKPEWGPGKVLARDGQEVLVYFRDDPAPVPEDRVRRFQDHAGLLQRCPVQSDEVLDRIPPYRNGRFERPKTSLTLSAARQRFLSFFPRGFADPDYLRRERGYKWAAHLRYMERVAPHLDEWLRAGNADDLREAIIYVYGSSDRADEPLNLMNPRFEWTAFRESLNDSQALLGYVTSASEFWASAEASAEQFHCYAEALARLPTRTGGTQLDKWTVLTWLPFIADPAHHIFLKPQMTQEFASLLPFELQYDTQLNPVTYRRLQEMARQLRARISDSEVNPEARDLDMIDVHSFMWIVVEYGK